MNQSSLIYTNINCQTIQTKSKKPKKSTQKINNYLLKNI